MGNSNVTGQQEHESSVVQDLNKLSENANGPIQEKVVQQDNTLTVPDNNSNRSEESESDHQIEEQAVESGHKSSVIHDLNKQSEEASDSLQEGQAEVVQHKDPLAVPLVDSNSNRTEESESDHWTEKQKEESERKEKTRYSTVLLELEESKTNVQEENITICLAKDENTIEMHQLTDTLDDENFNSETPEQVSDPISHGFTNNYETATKQIRTVEENELTSITSNGMLNEPSELATRVTYDGKEKTQQRDAIEMTKNVQLAGKEESEAWPEEGLLKLESSKTELQEENITISKAEAENRIEMHQTTDTLDSNGIKDDDNLTSELAEPVDDSVSHDFTIDYETATKQTQNIEQNDLTYISSNEMATDPSELAILTLCDAKEETRRGDATTMCKDGQLEMKEESEARPQDGKVVTKMPMISLNMEEYVGYTPDAFKLDSMDNGPSKLESSPSVELFYFEAIDMEIKRASLEIDEDEYKIKSHSESDLSAADLNSNSEKEENELGKTKEVRALQSQEQEQEGETANDFQARLYESFQTQIPGTIREILEEEIDMIEIPATSSMFLDLYSVQEKRIEILDGLLEDNNKLSDVSSIYCLESDDKLGKELIKEQQEEDLGIVDKSTINFRETNFQENSHLLDPFSSFDSNEQDKHSDKISSSPFLGSPQSEEGIHKTEREENTEQFCNYSSQLVQDSCTSTLDASDLILKDSSQKSEQYYENVKSGKPHQEQTEFQILDSTANGAPGEDSNSEEALVKVPPNRETEVFSQESSNSHPMNPVTVLEGEVSGRKEIDSGFSVQKLSDVGMSKETTYNKIATEKQEFHFRKEKLNGSCKSPAKKTISSSAEVREKQRSKSSIFSSCMCCTTVFQ